MYEPSSNFAYSRIVRWIVFVAVVLFAGGILFGPTKGIVGRFPAIGKFERVTGLGNPVQYLVWADAEDAADGDVFNRGESEFMPFEFVILVAIWAAIICLGIWFLRRIEYG